jgi:hypothetical protein
MFQETSDMMQQLFQLSSKKIAAMPFELTRKLPPENSMKNLAVEHQP